MIFMSSIPSILWKTVSCINIVLGMIPEIWNSLDRQDLQMLCFSCILDLDFFSIRICGFFFFFLFLDFELYFQ